jgi:hypothetical protein
MPKEGYKLSLYFSVTCFFMCLMFPAFYTGSDSPQFSLDLFLFGWLGPFSGHFAWYANPFYFLALKSIKSDESFISAIWVFIAICIGLLFLAARTICLNEGGISQEITGLGVGYFLWITSFIMLGITRIVYETEATVKQTAISSIIVLSVFWSVVCAIYYR